MMQKLSELPLKGGALRFQDSYLVGCPKWTSNNVEGAMLHIVELSCVFFSKSEMKSMNELVIFDKDHMSSLEIAQRTGKEHRNVLADIRKMLVELQGEGGVLRFQHTHINEQNGQPYTYFNLPKHECMVLVTGYSVTLRAKVLERWQELEDAEAQRQQASLALAQQEAQAQAQIAHEAQAKLQNTDFQIKLSKDMNKSQLTDWKHRFEPLRCSYLGVPNRWDVKYTPKEAVAALGDYVDEALDLIRTALQLRPALVFALKQNGIPIEVAYKVADLLERYARNQRKKEEAEGGAV